MRVAGFSFIRNAVQFDFPIVEAIRSVLPLCDEFVVAVGQSNDETLALIRQIDPQKVRIVETVWNDTLKEGGAVYADETNKAFRAISESADWCFYVQGDEVIHENDLPMIRAAMERWKDNKSVDGLLFNYVHFYGSYDFVGDSPDWYRHEIRVVRHDLSIYSYRDAQGFRKGNNKKLRVKLVEATVYHYGWVKDPRVMQAKHDSIHNYWNGNDPNASHTVIDYTQIDALARFTGTHPQVMQPRIARLNWQFNYDPTRRKMSVKNRFKRAVAQLTGWHIGEYRNYELI